MADPRLATLQQAVLASLSGDYGARVPVLGTDDELDAVCVGVNLNVSAAQEGTDVWIWVQDTGDGMDEVTRRRATEPLFTTKTDGNGFGLALAYTLCSSADGDLRIDSTPGEGTTVSLRLPVS